MRFFTIGETILRFLFGRPATLMYPAVPREFAAGSRGHLEIVIGDCIFCGLCQRKCPAQALAVDREAKRWEINRLRCITCSSCTEVCPKQCLTLAKGYSAAVCSPEAKEAHHA